MDKPDFWLIWQNILLKLFEKEGDEIEISPELKSALDRMSEISDEDFERWLKETCANPLLLIEANELAALSYEDYTLWMEDLIAHPEKCKKIEDEIVLLTDEELNLRLAKFCTSAILSSARGVSAEEVALLEIANPGLQSKH